MAPERFSFFKKHRKAWRRTGIVVIETLAVAVLLLFVAAGFLFTRLAAGPLDVGFARDYIQEALRNPERGITPTIGDMVLSWPDVRGPLLLGMKDVHVYDVKGRQVASVSEAALSLSKAALLIGRVSPVALIIRKPELRVRRGADGVIDIGFANLETYGPVNPSNEKEETGFITRILGYIAKPGQEDNSPLATLRGFKVENAKIVLEDDVMGVAWTAEHMDADLQSKAGGLDTTLYLEVPKADGKSSVFELNVLVPWDTKEVQARARFEDFDIWQMAGKLPGLKDFQKQELPLNGEITAILSEDLQPLSASGQLVSAQGAVAIPALWEKPLAYKDLAVHVSFDQAQKKFELADSAVTVGGVTIKAKSSLVLGEGVISGPLHLSVADITHKQMDALWPDTLRGDSSEEWILKKISGASFSDLYADIDLSAQKAGDGWKFDDPKVKAGFSFDNASVDYRPPLMPVTKGKGVGVFTYPEEKLAITIESAMISDLKVKSAELEFNKIIEHGKGTADLHVDLEGPIATGVKYLSAEPINMKHHFDVAKIKGNAALSVHVDFPTHHDVKVEEVKVGAEGTLTDVLLPGVVKNLDLSGGPMKIVVKDEELNVSGKGQVVDSAVDFEYKEFLNSEGQPYKNRIKAQASAGEALRAKLGIDLSDFLEGAPLADVTYTEYRDGHADADVKADLKPAVLLFDPFDYRKEEGKEGSVTLKADFADGKLQKIENMEVKGPDLALKNATLTFRQKGEDTILSKADFPDAVIGESKGRATLEVEDSGRYKINHVSSFFDMRPFLNQEEKKLPYDKPAMLITASAEKMRGADGSVLTNGKFLIDMDNQGRFDRLEIGAVAGKGGLALHFGPDGSGVRTFHFDAQDAGAALAAFGVYQNMRGGTINIDGKAKGPGAYDILGSAKISKFKVVKAPVIARLVGALSLPGLLELLTNQGLAFEKLEADYIWHYKPEGSVLEVKDGRTSGNSVGFAVEGTYNSGSTDFNVEGTVVPLSGVNKIIGKIPLVGDILTGGSNGGLIAATYTVKGKAADPSVMVNPLSVLAPGILRRILFE